MHFLSVLIELVDLSHHNLLGFFFYFLRLQARCADITGAWLLLLKQPLLFQLKTRKNSFYNFQKRENLGLVIYTTGAIIKSSDGDPTLSVRCTDHSKIVQIN